MMRKIMTAISLMIAVAIGVSACNNGVSVGKNMAMWKQIEPIADDGEVLTTVRELRGVETIMAAVGRASHDLYLREIGDSIATSFFEYSVTAVRTETVLEGRQPQESGSQVIVADVQVRNTFQGATAIPVGNYDFKVVWDEGEVNAAKMFAEGMYPDYRQLAQGETITGTLVFDIPEDVKTFKIVYEEIWDDGFKGNTYAFLCRV